MKKFEVSMRMPCGKAHLLDIEASGLDEAKRLLLTGHFRNTSNTRV
jgi:hypothetical protein